MSGEFWLIKDPAQLQQFCRQLTQFCEITQEPIKASYEIYKEPRSLSQNGLFWLWMDELGKYFTGKGMTLSKDEAHDLCCHQFLGYVTRTIGRTEIHSLRTTTWPTKLDTGEFTKFLNDIEMWSADKGCLLPIPAHAEYSKYKEAVA